MTRLTESGGLRLKQNATPAACDHIAPVNAASSAASRKDRVMVTATPATTRAIAALISASARSSGS